MKICRAKEENIDAIVKIMDEAKQYFKVHDIPQWQNENGYPNAEDVEGDIDKCGAWIIQDERQVVGYSFIDVYQDPNYAYIEGKWLNDSSYVVIHRTCVENAYKGKNIASHFIEKAKDICKEKNVHNIRVDTHEKNISMQHLLGKNGFVKVGIIYVEDGSPRYAYQLVI